MTAQEQQTWGQDWREGRHVQREGRPPRPRLSALDFDAWRPFFVTPKMIAYMNRPTRRSWFVFGGCGFMLFMVFVWAMMFWCILMVAITWDFGLLVAYAATLCTVGPIRRMRARRRARA